MSKYAITISGGASIRELTIEPGESLEVPLVWEDAVGAALDMGAMTVTFELYDAAGAKTYGPLTLSDPALLDVSGTATTEWKLGAYHAELWARGGGRSGAASFLLRVAD
jgi:hypothetical protein